MTTEKSAASTPAEASAGRPRRWRNLLVIVAAFLVVVGGLAGGTFYYFYDKATAIDRTTPQVVADQFLEATLKLKDAAQIRLFTCDEWSVEGATAKAAAPSDPRVTVSWGDFSTRVTGARATVSVAVFFSSAAGEDTETWTLHLENDSGWRVCDLTKETSLDP